MKRLFTLTAILASTARIGAAQQPADSTADSAKVRLPPVTVRATRSTQSVFATPLAISIIGRDQLDDRRAYSIEEGLQHVPGVIAQSRYGGSDVRLSIRGFGARGAGDRSNAGTSRGVRVLIDGIPETEPDERRSTWWILRRPNRSR